MAGAADFNTSTTSSYFIPLTSPNTTEELIAILERLNQQRIIQNIPAMLFVSCLMFLGAIGNSLVVYVYLRRFRKTSSNYFILTMAAFDLVACVVGMPIELYDLNNAYTFYSANWCKALRSTEVFTVYGSAIVLVEIGCDRYFKICRPLMMISLSKIRFLCGLAVVLAVILSVPSVFLFGIDKNHTPIPGISGYDCSITEEHKKSTFRTVYYGIQMSIFILTLVVLVALYTRIWREIRCRRKMVIGDQITRTGDDDSAAGGRKRLRIKYVPSLSEDEALNNTISHQTSNSGASVSEMQLTGKSINSQTSVERRSKMQSFAIYASRLKVTRTTVVLFAVTVAFVLSYLPSIAVMVIRSTVKNFDETQGAASQAILKIFANSIFINNAINPIIYSFLNIHFRRQVKKTVERVFCCCRRRRRRPPQKMDSDRSTIKEFVTLD